MRMHGLPTRTGLELIDRLRSAAEASDISIITESVAETLLADPDGRIRGVEIVRGDGTRERIGCDALILACNGYGGNPDLVRRFIPEMADALYFGHPGNRGDAVHLGRRARRATCASRRLSRPRLGRDAAQYPDHLGRHHAGRHSDQPRRPALLRRVAGLFRAGRGGAATAGWNCLERIRCTNCGGGATVRGFPRRRASGCDSKRRER